METSCARMTNPDEVKAKFYNDFDDVISAMPHTNKLILLGDFNHTYQSYSNYEFHVAWLCDHPNIMAVHLAFCIYLFCPS